MGVVDCAKASVVIKAVEVCISMLKAIEFKAGESGNKESVIISSATQLMQAEIDMGKKTIKVVHVFKGKKASKKNPGSVKGSPDLMVLASSTADSVSMVEGHFS